MGYALRVGHVASLAGTYLAAMAASLSSGQSRRLDTGLTGANVYYTDGSNALQWGVSLYCAPRHREIGFIGKRDGAIYPYRWMYYNAAANAWVLDRDPWTTLPNAGHGYDHNACDPLTGDVYHRPYGGETPVWKWTRSTQTWSALATLPNNTKAAGGLTWWPGKGLFTNCGYGLLRLVDGAWVRLQVGPFPGSYHDVGEYNPVSDCLIFGGGNESGYYKCDSALTVSTIATPPFALGANPGSQGTLVSAPGTDEFIARHTSTGVWGKYKVSTDTWTNSLTQATGNGDEPTSGLPNMTVSSNPALGVAVEELGCIFFVQHQNIGTAPAKVWIYKH